LKRALPPRSWPGAGALIGIVLCCAGASVAGGRPEPILWWNDPAIVEAIALRDDQRTKMDAAYSLYESRIESVRPWRAKQQDFLAAIEAGNFEKAQGLLEEWRQGGNGLQLAMAELKLSVLKELGDEQRTQLTQRYPRVVRRQWRPAASWAPSAKRKSGWNPRAARDGKRHDAVEAAGAQAEQKGGTR
jgi:hypothetical protein